jgi:DNA-directed RNA polymerase subunit RPC12/RpoP
MNSDKVEHANKEYKSTLMKKYGIDNPQKHSDIREKTQQTLMEKYGTSNILLLESSREANKKNRELNKTQNLYLKHGYNKFSEYVRNTFNFELLTNIDTYYGIRQKDAYSYRFKCLNCLTEVEKKFYHSRGINCEICNKKQAKFVSSEEQEIFNFIECDLGIKNGIQGDRTIINPYELDMVFPDQRIAIEYCGLFWHS